MVLPISREDAWNLILKYNSDKSDLNHYLMSEAIMREVANKLDEDIEYFGMLGLLHDIDWGITKNNSVEHLTKAPEILKAANIDSSFISIIVSHGYGFNCAGLLDKKRENKTEFFLAASETVSGLVYAYAIMRGRKISDMEVSGLKKKFKDKAFASGCNRDIIKECEKAGIVIDEFLGLAIEGLKKIKGEIGLE